MSVSPDEPLPARPFQFGLRALFISIALLSVILAIMAHLAPLWALTFGWFVLLIAAHVAGNFWGTRSRDLAATLPEPAEQLASRETPALVFVPNTRLRDRSQLTRTMQVTALVCSTLGSIFGTLTIISLYQDRVSSLGTTIASISGGMLGALLGFLASSFLGIAGRAFREAADDASVPRG